MFRMNRRAAVAGFSAAIGISAMLPGSRPGIAAQPAPTSGTPSASAERDPSMPLLSNNPMWEGFGQRLIGYTSYGGADLGEVISTIRRVGDAGTPDDWYREWRAIADRVAAIGDESAAAGHTVSAREAYLRASNYYHGAYMPLFGSPVDPRLTESFELETSTFQRGAELLDTPFEVIEIPFEDTTLPGYFLSVDDTGTPRPTVIHTNGYDGTIQEMYYAHAPAAIRRGYNVLLFDGPGQGRNLIRDGLTMRPDWENVVTPVVDYALTRPDVDPDRIVLNGWSFGGFLAPRAAGVEHRLAALVADPGQWDLRYMALAMLPLEPAEQEAFPDIDPALLAPMEQWLASPEADPMVRWQLVQRGMWVHGADSLYDYFADLVRFEVSSVAADITCPTFIAAPEGDPLAAGAPALYETISAENKVLMPFTEEEGAEGHCQALARTLYHQRVYDWLDETLGT